MLFLLLLLWLWLFVVVVVVAVVVLVFERMMPISDQAGKLVVPVMVVVFSCCCFSFCCCCWAVDADIRSGGEARATLAFVGFATHHH